MGIAEIQTSFPLIKNSETQNEILTPKISLRANPGNNMKDYSSSDKNIGANNIFEIKSSKILQPGPAALTDGLEEMIKIFKKVKV